MQRHLHPSGDPGRALTGNEPEDQLQPLATRYLTTVLQNVRGSSLGLRNERELRTVSEALDLITVGRIAEAGDLLMQRFKAIELASGSGEGGWNLARHVELIPSTQVSASTTAEARQSMKAEMETLKYEEKLRNRSRKRE